MANNPSELVAINEKLGDSFDNLLTRCEAYKQVLLKRKHDITEQVSWIWLFTGNLLQINHL